MENVEDVMMEIPVMKGVKRGWVGKEDDTCLYFRMDMPGLGEKHIKVAMEKSTDTLVIQGEIKEDKMGMYEAKEYEDDDAVVRKYRAIIEIPPNFFKIDEIKTEIKNGVLKVVVPKADGVGKGEKLVKFNIPNMEENPFLQGFRRDWCNEVHRSESMTIRIDMPGLGPDDVDVLHESGIDNETGKVYDWLEIVGLGEEENEYEGGGTRQIRCKIDNSEFFQTIRLFDVNNGVFVVHSSSLKEIARDILSRFH